MGLTVRVAFRRGAGRVGRGRVSGGAGRMLGQHVGIGDIVSRAPALLVLLGIWCPRLGMLGGLLGGSGLLGGLGKMIGGLIGGGNSSGISKVLEGFSPANIINATVNLVNAINGKGARQAVDTLAKEDGLPKYLQQEIKKVIDEVFKKFEKPTEGDLQDKLNNATKDDQQKSINDFAKQIIDSVRKQLTEKLSEGAEGSRGKGKKSAGSWLQAIAKAMGEAMGDRASKMVELSNKMGEAAKQEGDKGAKEMQSISSQFQAVSQEFNLLSNTFSTAIKSLGEGMTNMARKQ